MQAAPWNIKHIADELASSFAACHSDFERSMWRVFARKDVDRVLNGREPSPGESAILHRYGLI